MSGGDDFADRRAAAREQINALDRDSAHDPNERSGFFDTVYDRAGDDAALVPWADLAPKAQIAEWLSANPGRGRTAIDVACGLGDHAEALTRAGYATTAFDVSGKAVDWARQRFPESKVDYLTADLFDPPPAWAGGFDLVNECYTLQSLPPAMLDKTIPAVAGLVAPGGVLLVYARVREDDTQADGPPWPLTMVQARRFADFGLALENEERFDLVRPDKTIAHLFAQWRRPAGAQG